MFNILASSYMTASRMDQFLEQDFMHKDPRVAQRLRYIHGLDTPNPSLMRQMRGRIGMDGAIEHAHRPSRISASIRALAAKLGTALRQAGEWLEETASVACQTKAAPDRV